MTNLIVNGGSFESTLLDGVAVARLKGNVLRDLATSVHSADLYLDFLKSVNDSPEVVGFVQINDRGWDCRADAGAFVDMLTKEKERMPTVPECTCDGRPVRLFLRFKIKS